MPASLTWLVPLPDDQFRVHFLQHVKDVAKKHNRTDHPDLLIWSRITPERYHDWKEGVKLALEADTWAKCQEILVHTGRPKGRVNYPLPLDAIRAYIMRKEGQAWQQIIKTLPPQPARSLRIPERKFRTFLERELRLDLWS